MDFYFCNKLNKKEGEMSMVDLVADLSDPLLKLKRLRELQLNREIQEAELKQIKSLHRARLKVR